jgi:hypothetical protein
MSLLFRDVIYLHCSPNESRNVSISAHSRRLPKMSGDQQPKLQLRQKTTRQYVRWLCTTWLELILLSTKAGLSTVFVGLAFRFWPNKREYALVIHDGQGMCEISIIHTISRS